MFNTLSFFSTFCIIKTIKCSYQITSNTTDSFKSVMFTFFTTAFWTNIINDSVITTNRITIYRMINSSITYMSIMQKRKLCLAPSTPSSKPKAGRETKTLPSTI